jgi:hypothetical protein
MRDSVQPSGPDRTRLEYLSLFRHDVRKRLAQVGHQILAFVAVDDRDSVLGAAPGTQIDRLMELIQLLSDIAAEPLDHFLPSWTVLGVGCELIEQGAELLRGRIVRLEVFQLACQQITSLTCLGVGCEDLDSIELIFDLDRMPGLKISLPLLNGQQCGRCYRDEDEHEPAP